ncbi:hypothetical protein BDW74DRAFT_172591 [Aspergillus multicolor]|uniref:uncharacterized protein n=1 Tax=Aspergillus multicolor TaxID=41759 RepID=UPI003CCD28D5
MTASAETLFDYLGPRYEDAFSCSAYLTSTIRTAIEQLPPNSHILDIGCGTGKPVSSMLADAGHKVHGIDVSTEMVKIASKQVPGRFEKLDMRTFKPHPKQKYDAIFAILSIFQITPGDTVGMCYKWSEWLKPGGMVVVGITPSTSLPPVVGVRDSVWDCTRQLGKPWMDQYTNEVFFSEEKWRAMLGDAGFKVEAETFYDFVPEDGKHKTPERHHFFFARKVEREPLLGPYPVPKSASGLSTAATAAIDMDQLVSEDLGNLLSELRTCQPEVLYLGPTINHTSFKGDNITSYNGPLESLPYQSQCFSTVLALMRMDTVKDTHKALSEISRVTSRIPGSQIIIIQGTPDNETAKLWNSACPTAQKVQHQGRLLRSAMEELADQGFGHQTLSRFHAQYVFHNGGVEEKCGNATKLFIDLCKYGEIRDKTPMEEELCRKLSLHFEDGTQTLRSDLAMLTARQYPN